MVKIHTESIYKIAYSTDASIYREIPRGVAFPETEQDIVSLINFARSNGTYLIPRAGGTSIAGQVTGNGIVVDISRHFNRILEINPEEKWVRVQPGVVRDVLNQALEPYGLFFSPETSTSNRCCIGGMVGNNSCGAHSLIYGSTRDHILQLKGFLSDGSRFDTSSPGEGELEKKIYAFLREWRSDATIRKLLEENFPDKSLKRRSCGYAIDEAILGDDIDLCKLICGSEGTLAFVTEIKLSLDKCPPKEKMVLCAHCNSLEDSFEANIVALKYGPSAVELMDGRILELSRENPEAEKNRFFVEGEPAALIISEFNGADMESAADRLELELKNRSLASVCTRVYNENVSKVWALRKAGLGVLSGMKGDAKPVGVIEDTAVAPERMAAYMRDFRKMLDRLGLDCVFYGHISTGELHLRPILNLKTVEGRKLFRQVAMETAALVRKHKGSLSGEHGDGRLRGEFIPVMYGNECYALMCGMKKCFDPDGVFNMNKIVNTPAMDDCLRYEAGRRYSVEGSETYFNWKASFDNCKVAGTSPVHSQLHALMCTVEQCNGSGDCRRPISMGGTMCPAFKLSGNELDTTRARANVLRECLTYGDGFDAPEIREVLSSCLACKGCHSECPSGVDMTRIRAEVLQQIYDRKGTPFRSFAVARMASVEKIGHFFRPIYNLFASWDFSSRIIKSIIGFASERNIPSLCRTTMRSLVRKENKESAGRKGLVYLFADEFTNYQEAEIGRAFAHLLVRLGYDVRVPKHVESGRAAISKGCLKLASKYASKNVRLLRGVISSKAPLVGIEPSCILSFRDEYPDLVSREMRQDALDLSENCLLYDEFLSNEISKGNISCEDFKDDPLEIWLHGHCHQKALVGIEKTASVLRLLRGAELNVIPSGCCGMAGSFGYEKEHFKTSLEIGEMILFPAVRRAVENASGLRPVIVSAPGTSCRQQILDGTGVRAVHPIAILDRWVK